MQFSYTLEISQNQAETLLRGQLFYEGRTEKILIFQMITDKGREEIRKVGSNFSREHSLILRDLWEEVNHDLDKFEKVIKKHQENFNKKYENCCCFDVADEICCEAGEN